MLLAAAGSLTSPDYIVIALYLAMTLAIGVLIGRRLKTSSDFFLAGRRLPWWAVGLSLVATDIGGTDIIGVGGAAYRHGLAVANFEWIGCVPAMIVGAFVFIPFFYRTGVCTIPEYFERRFNAGVRTVMASCWLLFMACNLGILLWASARMMASLFGWPLPECIVVTAVLVGAYTCMGGLAAVVYTDTIQCAVMIAGCLMVLVLGIIRVGGVGELRDRLAQVDSTTPATAPDDAPAAVKLTSDAARPADVEDARAVGGAVGRHTALILPVDTPTPFPWPGIYFGLALILSPAYWIGNQAIVQRSLGARSEFEARASFVWGALLKNVIPLIVAVPGLIAAALLPNLKDGDAAIPQLIGILLPTGLRGVFVAAFLAALMSSVDSYLNSAATILSSDIYRRFIRPDVSESGLLRVGRISTVLLMVWAVAFAFLLTTLPENSGIYAVFQTLMAFFQGPAFAILLFGILWRRATGRAALIALLCGIATAISLFVLNLPAVSSSLGWKPLFQIQDPYLYFSVWAFVVTAVMVVVISLLTKPDHADKLAYVYSRVVPPASPPEPHP